MTNFNYFKFILLSVVMMTVCLTTKAQDPYREAMKEYVQGNISNVNEEKLLGSIQILNRMMLLGYDQEKLEELTSKYRKEKLQDDILDYMLIPPFKECVTLEELQALNALMKTPEGQNYQAHEKLLKQKLPLAYSEYLSDAINISLKEKKWDGIKPDKQIPQTYIKKYYEAVDTAEIYSIFDAFFNMRSQTIGDTETMDAMKPHMKKNFATIMLNASYGIYTEADLDFLKSLEVMEGYKHTIAATKMMINNAVQYNQQWVVAYSQWLLKKPEVCDFNLQKIVDEGNVNMMAKELSEEEIGQLKLEGNSFIMEMLLKSIECTNEDKTKLDQYGKDYFLNQWKYDEDHLEKSGFSFLIQLIAYSKRNLVIRLLDNTKVCFAEYTIDNKELVYITENMEIFRLVTKGDKLMKEEKYDEALPLLKQAAETGDPAAQYTLGNMYNLGNGMEENLEEAMKWYDMAAKQDNKQFKANSLNEMAYVYLKLEQYGKAIETIDKAIETIPSEANFYDSKGEILYKMGNKKEARAMWNKVVGLEPDFAQKNNSELYKLLFDKKKK